MAIRRNTKKGVTIVDTDLGWERLRREVEKSRAKPHVAVGVFGEQARASHSKPSLTVGALATIHEFGLGAAKERSFLRDTIDGASAEIRALTRKLAALVVAKNGMPIKRALGLLGAFVHGKVIRRINRGIPPPLDAAYARRKGSSKTLVDTGQLKSANAWETRNV